MPVSRPIGLNLALVLVIAAIGVVTDEPYWRDNGHEGDVYNYWFWAGLGLNGPSGFLADWIGNGLLRDRLDIDGQFGAQFASWCVLLVLQWWLYDGVARWAASDAGRRLVVHALSLVPVVGGWICAIMVWRKANEPYDLFRDRYFWLCRYAGLACAAIWISALTEARAARWRTRKA